MYKKLKKREVRSVKELSTPIIICVAAVNMFVVLFTPELVEIIGSEKYKAAIDIMPILTFSVCLMLQTSIYNNIEIFYEKNRVIMVSSIVLSLLNVILNYYFISAFGYQAAAYTTLACYLIMLIWHIVYTLNRLPDAKECVSIKVIVVSNILLAVCVALVTVYNYNILVRIIMLAIILLVILLKSKDIIRRIKGESKTE